ncbi:hypothetical protein [Rhizobium paknamense]|uniref:Uncharacterized protein n=1 Tax=Rhizobium paknamense TaxID=1206817 RepID=A0ABU0IHT4_9HYPH|nr:hypothetical protein [Rhizobium paknamense]MDQ0457193.1 hypothetical protein [Rhizobium paknamense]
MLAWKLNKQGLSRGLRHLQFAVSFNPAKESGLVEKVLVLPEILFILPLKLVMKAREGCWFQDGVSGAIGWVLQSPRMRGKACGCGNVEV